MTKTKRTLKIFLESIKGTVNVISGDPVIIDFNVRFTIEYPSSVQQ